MFTCSLINPQEHVYMETHRLHVPSGRSLTGQSKLGRAININLYKRSHNYKECPMKYSDENLKLIRILTN